MTLRRDPVSELFDAGARALLARAYAAPGTWQGTRLRNPGPRHLSWLAGQGISPFGPDDKSGEGRLNARTRWARGFVRALYYQHRWWSDGSGGWRDKRRSSPRSAGGIEVEVGRALPGGRQAGAALVPGRAVRVRYHRRAVPRGEHYTTDASARASAAQRSW